MKLIVLGMILLMLQVTITMFDQTTSMDSTDAVPTWYNESRVVNGSSTAENVSSSMVWSFVSNPTRWTDSDFLVYLVAFIAAIAISGITILGSTAISSDTVRFAPIFMALMGLGSVPITSFWRLLQREVSAFACEPLSLTCWAGWLIPFIFVGPLAFMWFLACFTHWRTGLTTS